MAAEEGCELFGDFGVIIQAILGVVSIMSLLRNSPSNDFLSSQESDWKRLTYLEDLLSCK